MAIKPAIRGLGGSSSGIIGSTGTEGTAGENLRRDVMAFATAYSQLPPDSAALLTAAKALEGSLLVVKAVSGISDAKLDQLLAELHELVPAIDAM